MRSKKKQSKTRQNSNSKQQTPPITIMPSPDDDRPTKPSNDNNKPKYRKFFDQMKQWKTENIISSIQLVATVILIWVAFIQNDQAERSAVASEVSAQAAQDAMNLTREQFQADKTPFLVVSEIESIFIDKERRVNISYRIKNLGTYPVKSDCTIVAMSFGQNGVTDSVMVKSIFNKLNNRNTTPNIYSYYIHNSPVHVQDTFKGITSPEMIDSFRNGNMRIYFGATVYYTNLVGKEHYKFTYVYKVVSLEPPLIQGLFIDNTLIKK